MLLPLKTTVAGQQWSRSCEKDHSAVTIMSGTHKTSGTVAYVPLDFAKHDCEQKNTIVSSGKTSVIPVVELRM